MRKIVIIISCLIIFIIAELINRFILSSQLQLPFSFDTRELQYPSLYHTLKQYNPNKINVLLLGGSVLEFVAEKGIYNKIMNDPQYSFLTLAKSAESSLDNYYQYEYAVSKGYRFDIVVFYNSINDVRMNNVPPALFSASYDHNMFYRLSNMVFRKDSIGNTIMRTSIGYSLYKSYLQISENYYGRFIPMYILSKVKPEWLQYGDEIKTNNSFRTNLLKIIQIAKQNHSTLIVPKFAYQLPDSYSYESFHEHTLGYCEEKDRGYPVEIWGNPNNVKKGLEVHNSVLDELANQYLYIDTSDISSDISNFCDICHFSDIGIEKFAHIIVQTIKQIR